MYHNKKNAKSVYKKVDEIDQISRALAIHESFNPELLSNYKHWSLRHIIYQSILEDIHLLRKYLKLLIKTDNLEERNASISMVNSISFNLISYCNGLEFDHKNNRDYIRLFKREAKQFRILYKKWSKSFIL